MVERINYLLPITAFSLVIGVSGVSNSNSDKEKNLKIVWGFLVYFSPFGKPWLQIQN